MSENKPRQSKLDPHIERLDEWYFIRNPALTHAQVREELLKDGISVSESRLSDWWSARSSERLEKSVLAQIATGSRMVREVEDAFAKNPGAEIETLIKMSKLLIMDLQVKGTANPKLLSVANSMQQTVLEFFSGQTKARQKDKQLSMTAEDLKLRRDKFEFDAAKLALAKLPQLRAIAGKSSLDQKERIDQARLALFGSAPE